MERADIAIAGAGIIGLAAALELASAGKRVVVFERGRAMRECSWAAAGMLAANDPENPPPLHELSEFSLSLYPRFLANIERLSGKKVPIRTAQTLHGGHTLPPKAEVLSPEAIQAVAPGLETGGLKFFLLEEQSLDPRDLTEALPEAAKAAGIALFERTTVTSVAPHTGSIKIQTTRGVWTAENFINAAGAWSSSLTGISIVPRKGQALLVEIPEAFSHQLTVVLHTPNVYLVPRDDQRILIGATVEDAGYDKQTDPTVIAALQNAAAELWPPIRHARIVETWAGLRPASADSLPVIGIDERSVDEDDRTSDQTSRLWLAIGHFRNGVLLAPGTARLLRQMILNEPLSIDTSAFHANRFIVSLAQ